MDSYGDTKIDIGTTFTIPEVSLSLVFGCSDIIVT
jgi:hypothetical protein